MFLTVQRLLGIPLHCGRLLNRQHAKAVWHSASLWKTAQPVTCKGCFGFRFAVEDCSTGNVHRLLGIPLHCGKLLNRRCAKAAWHSTSVWKTSNVQRLLGIPLHCRKLLDQLVSWCFEPSQPQRIHQGCAQPATWKGYSAIHFSVENCSTSNVQRLLGIPLQCGKLLNQQRAKAAWHPASL